MKKICKCVALVLPVVLALGGCSVAKNDNTTGSDNKPAVSVVDIEMQTAEEYLTYSGYVAADEQKKYSFELAGTIKKLYVEKGDEVKAGQTLAELDTTSVNLAVNNANENIKQANNAISQCNDGINTAQIALNAEKLTLEKTQTGIDAEELTLKKIQDSYASGINELQLKYDNAKQTFDDTGVMYQNGVVSKNDYDNAKLAFDTVSEELEKTKNERDNDVALEEKKIETMRQNYSLQEQSVAAKEAEIASLNTKKQSAQISLNQANISLQQNQKYISDSVLKATIDGYVMELPVKEGEVTGAGTPVVVVKGEKQVVNVGVPVDDYSKISTGMKTYVESDDVKVSGLVDKIELYPSETTRTYNMKVSYDGNTDFAIGSLVTVRIPLSQKEIFEVPISSVINIDGVDYVFYVEQDGGKDVAKLCTVTLGNIDGNNVEVSGVENGMRIIKDGVKNVTENQEVTVVGE